MNKDVLSYIKDFCAKHEITSGLTQEQHTAMVTGLIGELVFTEATPDEKKELFTLLYPLMNGSALRQKLESAGVLKKAEGGRRGADAASLANKWAAGL